MNNRATTLEEHSKLSFYLLRDLNRFVVEIGKRKCIPHFKDVTMEGEDLNGTLLGQKPERFVEDYLIIPILHSLDHEVRARPISYVSRWPGEGDRPNFCLTTYSHDTEDLGNIRLIVEVKLPNNIESARSDIRDYMRNDLGVNVIGIATDGVDWELWKRPRKTPGCDDIPKPELHAKTSLEGILPDVKLENYEGSDYSPHAVRSEIDVDEFKKFSASSVESIISDEFGVDVPSQ